MTGRGSPAFSVVIPTRERPAQLASCLDSLVRAQEPPGGFEVIVVDDGGDAQLEAVLGPLRDRLELTLLHRPHRGPAAARNAGVQHARGEMLAFTDDDMLVDPGWLAALAARSSARPGAAIGGRTVNALAGNRCSRVSQWIVERAYSHHNEQSDGPRFFAANNLALPAADFRDLGGFDPAFRTSEDRDLCARWRESGRPMAYAPEAVALHARELDLAGFWRQHFGYGRGAFAHRRASRARGAPATDRIQPAFHLRVMYLGLRRLISDPREALLIVLWQLANAAGFLREGLTSIASRLTGGANRGTPDAARAARPTRARPPGSNR